VETGSRTTLRDCYALDNTCPTSTYSPETRLHSIQGGRLAGSQTTGAMPMPSGKPGTRGIRGRGEHTLWLVGGKRWLYAAWLGVYKGQLLRDTVGLAVRGDLVRQREVTRVMGRGI
jgi:hypothetical protein